MSVGMIDTSRIQAMAAQLQAMAARAAPPSAPGIAGLSSPSAPGSAVPAQPGSFVSALKSSLDQVNQAQLQAQSLSERFSLGDRAVSLSDAMISMQKANISLQETIQIRNRVVSAYQEIMNMGI